MSSRTRTRSYPHPPPRRMRPRHAALLATALALTALGSPAEVRSAPGKRSAAALPVSSLVLEGPARPGVQVDTPGRRAIWLGTEVGDFEAWVYPLKVVRGLELSFRFRDRTWSAAELARRVEVRPEWTAITYGHEAFSVRQVVATPIDEPAALMLLEVEASFPLTIEVSFHIDLAPMWPAGLGGQYSYWDAALPGFVIGEGSGRNLALVAAPGATEPTIQPAHSLPDQPTRFAIPVAPTGGTPVRHPLVVTAWTEGMEGAAGLEALRERYRRLVADPVAALEESAEHYRRLEQETVRVRTPEPRIDEAFRWAKVRLDQGVVCNPHLGCGLIAGFGRARAGYRPGFGWFFGGDALYNSWALGAMGAHDTVATALEFLARYQRDDGKIMHELSQGAGTLDWFEDYPYGFYHAEGSPYFIDAVARHVRATGDLEWGRRILPAVQRAYAYSRAADGDGDGLMENTLAGLGAVEMGALREAAVHQDLYLVSIWARALRSLGWLAEVLGEADLAAEVAPLAERAAAAVESTYWLPDSGHYAFATLSDGSRLEELTLWSALPGALGLSPPQHGAANVAAVASPAVTTDWGTRMLASTSHLYDPLVYNQGTVWPFLSGFAGLAAWEYANPWAGLDLLRGLAELTLDHSRGAVHEVLSGDRYEPMGASVPHQLFSTSSLVTPLVRGLFGLEVDAVAGSITLRPNLPAHWPWARIENVPYRDGRVHVELTVSDGRMQLSGAAPDPVRWRLDPALPPGSTEVRVGPAGSAAPGATRRGVFTAAGLAMDVFEGGKVEQEWRWQGGIPVAFDSPRAAAAGGSIGLRVLGAELDPGGGLRLTVAGRPGVAYRSLLPADGLLEFVAGVAVPGADAATGARIEGGELRLLGSGDGYRGAVLLLHRAR